MAPTVSDASTNLLASERGWISWRSSALLFLFGLGWLLPFLGSSRAVSYHEMIFAQPAREMIATGDWLQPRVAGVPNNHKPPLQHWLIALCMLAAGSQSEWVVRLPSVAAAIATAWLMAGLATRWFGQRAGLLAGAIQLTTYYLLRFGKLADADMLLCATVCGALVCFMLAHVESPHGTAGSRWLGLLFYVAAGLSFLVKGPIGSVFVFGAAAMYLVWSRHWPKRWFFLHPAGLAIYLFLALAWPYAAYRAQPDILDDWLLHNVGRFQGELRGFKHPLYYLYSLPAFMLPWTPLAVYGARWCRRHPDRMRELGRMIVCWLVPGLIVISASAFKRKHYAMPLLPPLSVLAAVGLCQIWYARRTVTMRIRVALVTAAVMAIAVATATVASSDLPSAHALAALLVAVSSCAACALWLRDRAAFVPGLGVLFASGWLLFVSLEGIVAPHYDSYRSQRELAQRVNQRPRHDEPLYLVHLPENQVTYYLDGPLARFDKEQPFVEHLVKQASSCATELTQAYTALAPAYVVERLRQAGQVVELDHCETIEPHTPARAQLTYIRFRPIGSGLEAFVKGAPQRR
jgi:4-amino-4-deoxy-L-arabinose transferase-like glycosyltransferase